MLREDGVDLNKDMIEIHMGLWGKNILSAELKDFLYRYTQGRLHMNQNRAHFEDVSPACTFCTIRLKVNCNVAQDGEIGGERYIESIRNIAHENTVHLFWNCREVEGIRNWLFEHVIKKELLKGEFMLGKELGSHVKSELLLMIVHWFKWWIYNKKLQLRMPNTIELEYDINKFISKLCKNRVYRERIEKWGEMWE